MPPYFAGDALRFGSIDELKAACDELSSVGAVLAVCDHKAPLQPVELRVHAGAREARVRVRCSIHPMQAGTVVVQALEKKGWAPVLEELCAIAPAPTSTSMIAAVAFAPSEPSAPAPQKPLSLPRAGRLWNPTTPAGIFALPLQRAVADADLQRPSVPLLLRWLRTTRGVLRLDLNQRNTNVCTLYFVDGREVRASVAAPSLGRALSEAEYDYEVAEIAKAPNLAHPARTLHVVVEVVRSLLAQHATDEIARAFPQTHDPRMVRAVTSVAEALGFTGAHARLVKGELSGDGTVEDVLGNAIGPRTAWDVLTLLHLYDGLSFVAGERRAASTPTSALAGLPPEAMLEKDFFTLLGLHWSSAPSEVATAYQQTRQAWNGPRRPADQRLAEQILARIEEAHRTLRDDERRRAYRRATFHLVWPHQAQLLVSQAKLALYRQDFAETSRLLHAAEDLSPSADAARMLLALANASGKQTE